ncbi:hypothetical protein SAMN02745945_01423 [Peptoclostridium litorale DSM 5388]|uniref:Iron-sulfur-binding protein n=1 Tax=Peptoclostridium litorale DSM 5388 TaxID=1121324 RepID=A0A069RN16_PEPLI|nr:4Fe-4S binding protein [Peptoclostridium litorale]KDR95572.1 iron-sulfur-binding protein [Peptoclostridium litorale DSM 5388]SIN98552.1 hypothetical protein SAMN02745945_01423 [Peptoclostridium litorale DSM 5388]
MGMKNKKVKSHQGWSWIFLVGFLLLSVVDFRFGILGLICMTMPMYHALRGRGKVHCSHYCPRGSLLGKFLKNISLNQTMPKWMNTKYFKNSLLLLMMAMFTVSLIHSGGDFTKISFAIFRLMSASLALGIAMGVIFKPRSWCQVCPMGHATGIIKNYKDASDQSKSSALAPQVIQSK